jgi:NAD+ synthase (glutamine-hydrolysing)
MSIMKILTAQIDPVVGDFKGNVQKIIHSIKSARSQKADMVVFPEMAICGYPPEDLLLHSTFIDAMEKALEQVILAAQGITVVVGLVRRNPSLGEKPLFNSAAIIQNGKLLGFHDKWLLPTYDVFDERRYFEPGSTVQVWEVKGKRIGVLICEDIWQHAGYEYVGYTHYRADPVTELSRLKPDVLLNLSASPYQFMKPDMRIRVCEKSAQTLKCPLILCCQVGGNDQLVFDGYSALLDEDGKLRALAAGFEEDELLSDLDRLPPLHTFRYDPLADLYHALVLGTRDYFHKQGFKKGCIGLSGGIDSALVACIAVDALGKENVLGIAMPSRYSSPSSLKDAEQLAHNLGIPLKVIPIEAPFEAYLNLLEPHFEGRPWDVTEENMQSRVRGGILMSLSNKLGYIVLSTGNKSELALGYCTLYGDMVGGLAVISDVTKKQVYELAHWINREREIIPHSTIQKPPSAELKPNQKDTDTLPEYPIVDAVLQGYVEDRLSPEEIAKKHQLSLDLVRDLIHKIHLAEYKRRQAAPGIRVTKRSFRVGRRYPIVQTWM